MKILYIVLILTILSCGNNSSKTTKSNQKKVEVSKSVDFEKQFQENLELSKQNSLKKIEIESELKRLKSEGVIGMWECNFSGYESIIKIFRKNGKYSSEIDFTKSKMKTKTEKLTLNTNKYFVQNSKNKEYYLIKEDGNLEMGDKQGLFTTALNIKPGSEKQKLPKFDPNEIIGENIFTVVGNYSKSQPQTLKGTNNEFWLVFYEDLNTEFKVVKGNNKIVSATVKDE